METNKDCHEADTRTYELIMKCDSSSCRSPVNVYHKTCLGEAPKRILTITNQAFIVCSYCKLILDCKYWKLICLGNSLHLGESPLPLAESEIKDTCKQLRGVYVCLEESADDWIEEFFKSLNAIDKKGSYPRKTFNSQPKKLDLSSKQVTHSNIEISESNLGLAVNGRQSVIDIHCQNLMEYLERLYNISFKSRSEDFPLMLDYAQSIKDTLIFLHGKFEKKPTPGIPEFLLSRVTVFEKEMLKLPKETFVIGKVVLDHVVNCLKHKRIWSLDSSTVKLIQDEDRSRCKDVDSGISKIISHLEISQEIISEIDKKEIDNTSRFLDADIQ